MLSKSMVNAAVSNSGTYRVSFPIHSNKNSRLESGLSIVELLVSFLIIAIAINGAASLLNNSIFGLRRTESNYGTQNLIDRNLSQIESAADRYVCTSSGACSVSATIPGKSGYVSPNDSAAWDSFKGRCRENDFSNKNDLVSPLADYIESNISAPSGLYREIQVNGSGSTTDVGQGTIKHLTVQYRAVDSSGAVIRNSTIVPTILSYCP